MLGVVKLLFADTSAAPPDAAEYQSTTLGEAVAESVTGPLPHMAAPVPVGATGKERTVAVSAVRARETQPVVVFLASAK